MSLPARDAQGRLLPGHTANPNGRPPRERETAILDAIRSAFSPEEITDILKEAVQLAREQKSARGLIAAITPTLEYALGKPQVKIQTGSTKFEDLLSRLGSNEVMVNEIHQAIQD